MDAVAPPRYAVRLKGLMPRYRRADPTLFVQPQERTNLLRIISTYLYHDYGLPRRWLSNGDVDGDGDGHIDGNSDGDGKRRRLWSDGARTMGGVGR